MWCIYQFVSAAIFFISVLRFSDYGSFASLGRFIPRYFVIFDVLANGIVSLISLSELVLLVYRNAINLCINFVSCNFTNFIDAPVVFWQHF